MELLKKDLSRTLNQSKWNYCAQREETTRPLCCIQIWKLFSMKHFLVCLNSIRKTMRPSLHHPWRSWACERVPTFVRQCRTAWWMVAKCQLAICADAKPNLLLNFVIQVCVACKMHIWRVCARSSWRIGNNANEVKCQENKLKSKLKDLPLFACLLYHSLSPSMSAMIFTQDRDYYC